MKSIEEWFSFKFESGVCRITARNLAPHRFEINFREGADRYAAGLMAADEIKSLGKFFIEVSDKMQADEDFKKDF